MRLTTRFFYFIARHFHKKFNRPLRVSDRQFQTNYKNIVVLSTTAIGDTLLSTPVFAALRREFPEATIKVLIQKKFIPLFSSNPHVDGFIPFQKGFINFFKTVDLLRQEECDIAFVLHISDPLPAYMTVLAKIPFLVGYPPDQSTSAFFSYIVHRPVGQHCIFQRLAVIEAVFQHHLSWSPRLVLSARQDRREEIIEKYKKYGLPNPDNVTLVGFQPGASKQFKMWPPESFVALGKELLASNENIVIVILGSRAEKKLGNIIAQGIKSTGRVFSLCGEISIGDLPTIVSLLKTLVTNDTGTMHIAVALKVPTVSLFVPTSCEGTGPLQDREIHHVVSRLRPCGDQCVTKKCAMTPACMSLLPVDEVLEATLLSLES